MHWRDAGNTRGLTAPGIDLWWAPHTGNLRGAQRKAQLDALLRDVLSRYVGRAPAALRFGRETRGRPYLRGIARAPDFNLSDTRGGSVLAVSALHRVGIDLERLDREPSFRALAERYFAAEEAASLAALGDAAARLAFLQLWTAKEAACKSTGTGIYGWLPLWRFAVPADAPQLLQAPPEAGAAADWRFVRFAPGAWHTAVIAWRGAPCELRGWTLRGSDGGASDGRPAGHASC